MMPLKLDGHMRALIGGAFYPTNHTMVMFASEELARDAAQRLRAAGFAGDMYWAPPDVVLAEIEPTVRNADQPLPSAGTDAATAREFLELAEQGHAMSSLQLHPWR